MPPGRSVRQQFAATLWKLAELEEAAASRRSFRARAYSAAVWSLDSLSPSLGESADEMLAVPGVGVGVAGLIEEYLAEGRLRRLDVLLEQLPREAGRLRSLPRMTPHRLRWLKERLGVEGPADLAEAIEAGALGDLPGVGTGTAEVWRNRLAESDGAMPIFRAAAHGRQWVGHLESHLGAEVRLAGAIRRLEERVPVLDLVVVGGMGLGDFLTDSALTRRVTREGPLHRVETLLGRMRVHHADRDGAGTALILATGPGEHVDLLARRGGGAVPAAATEHAAYRRVELPFIPPPARSEGVPRRDLVLKEHLRGDLHLHTDWSPDGHQTMRGMVEAAASRRYRYLALTDHTVGLRFGGLDAEALAEQAAQLEELRAEFSDLLIIHGAELNMGRDGSLDLEDEVLARLDFRLVAVHSHFDLDPVAQTDRLLAAIHHPLTDAVAHLTGRRIGIRPPIRFDRDVVFAAAAATSTALEVNGHLDRLDLSAPDCRRAMSHGALFLANSDSHRPHEWDNVSNAVGVLQGSGVGRSQVINTWGRSRLESWLRRDRGCR